MDTTRFPALVGELYRLVAEFEAMFPGRHFTPDGHMVGSLGEAIAAHHYDLELLTASNKGFDAVRRGQMVDGTPVAGELQVEIKATQGRSVAFRSAPQHALVLQLHRDGSFTEIYNGPGALVWALFAGKPMPSNGQHQVSLTRLRRLAAEVPEASRLKRRLP